MSWSSIASMVLIVTVAVGGFIYFLAVAYFKESDKKG